MDAPSFNGEPGARPYDRDHDEQREPEPQVPLCRDCGARICLGGTTTGVASGASCRACYCWRVRLGVVDDVRTRPEIAAAMAQDAAASAQREINHDERDDPGQPGP